MKGLHETLSSLMTNLSSDARFNSPKNQAKIESDAKKLAQLAHDLNKKGMNRPDQDPSVAMVSEMFSHEAQHAYQALKSGHRQYARGVLKSISGLCITCHTRTNSGPQFQNLALSPTASDLSNLELGEFFAATRQYDRALEEFQKLIQDPSAPSRKPFDWEKAVRYSLAIAVRVKKDPGLAKNIVEAVISTKNGPFYLRQDALQWKQSLIDWEKESSREMTSEEGYRNEALRLLSQAHQVQKYPVDRSADMIYLRASSVIHDWMRFAPQGKNMDEAFLLAGVCYEVLKPLQLGELHEMYYEACVRKAPHTPTSEQCYRRLERSIYDGFTGSSGTHVPSDVVQKLKMLEGLAHPQNQMN